MVLVTPKRRWRLDAASDLCRVLHMVRRRMALVHLGRRRGVKWRVWPSHTSRRVPSECMRIFESLRPKQWRKRGRAKSERPVRDLIAIAIAVALLATLLGNERRNAWQSLAFLALGFLIIFVGFWLSQ